MLDSNYFVASFLSFDGFHQQAKQFFEALEGNTNEAHVPNLVLIEVCGAINRQARRDPVALVIRARLSFATWESMGKLKVYELNRGRESAAVEMAVRYGLRGGDAVVAALAEELGFPLLTFDDEMLGRYPNARHAW